MTDHRRSGSKYQTKVRTLPVVTVIMLLSAACASSVLTPYEPINSPYAPLGSSTVPQVAQQPPPPRQVAQQSSGVPSLSDSTRTSMQRALAMMDRLSPTPPPCLAGYAPNARLYLVNLTGWAEQAGLRRGDRMIAVGGTPVSGLEDHVRALQQLPATGSLPVTVSRRGEALPVVLPCTDSSAVWSAGRRVVAAGAQGNWEECVRASGELEVVRGMTGYSVLNVRLFCLQASVRAPGKPYGVTEAKLLYGAMVALLRESRYDPDGLDHAKGPVLTNSTVLRRNGFSSLADDLDAHLRQAQAAPVAEEPTTRPPKIETAEGTAFAVRPDGTLLTAFHVVQGAKTIKVTCPGGRSFPGTVDTTSERSDLAVVKISRATLDYLSLATARSARVGDPVFTVGFPVTDILGREPKFTDGAISALSGHGDESSLMQVTVPIQPGNSGGALVNNRGEVVGIITSTIAVAAFLQEIGTLPQSVNWAVKSEYALSLFDRPSSVPGAQERRDAITRAIKATCRIEAVR